MKSIMFAALALGAVTSVAPAVAQTAQEQARFDAAQRRYDSETALFRQESDRYQQARAAHPRGYRPGYDRPGYDPRPGYDSRPGYDGRPGYDSRGDDPRYADRDEGNYDPSRYYRDGSQYQERTLSSDDRVYRGSDGRYYCKRNDGTTGLIVGAVGGGILGNVIDGGHSRAVGTLLGGALGALAGKSIDQSGSKVSCR